MARVKLIGVDCAVRARSVGIAVARVEDGVVTIESLTLGTGKGTLANAMAPTLGAIIDEADPVILALDAPLGWPSTLADALQGHRAGERIGILGDADGYVYRRTDEKVGETITWPLDVGANFIARTAFAALELLSKLRERGRKLPMLWTPGVVEDGVIEVYPKATFMARGWPVKDYKGKGPNARGARARLLDLMSTELTIPEDPRATAVETDHALDAIACVLAAKDFADGNVVPCAAEDRERAEREGWIWFRPPLTPTRGSTR
ncbi:DUF429 domain-containing protein [soil metagenome]